MTEKSQFEKFEHRVIVDRFKAMAKSRLLQEFYSLEKWQSAWQHIKANNGTAEVDGETIAHFNHNADIYIS